MQAARRVVSVVWISSAVGADGGRGDSGCRRADGVDEVRSGARVVRRDEWSECAVERIVEA
jgi:hypothetical protein